MNYFKLTILTPDGPVFDDSAESVVVPGVAGEFTVMAHHAPLIAAGNAGVLRLKSRAGESFYAVDECLVNITPEGASILATQVLKASSRDDALSKAQAFSRPGPAAREIHIGA